MEHASPLNPSLGCGKLRATLSVPWKESASFKRVNQSIQARPPSQHLPYLPTLLPAFLYYFIIPSSFDLLSLPSPSLLPFFPPPSPSHVGVWSSSFPRVSERQPGKYERIRAKAENGRVPLGPCAAAGQRFRPGRAGRRSRGQSWRLVGKFYHDSERKIALPAIL